MPLWVFDYCQILAGQASADPGYVLRHFGDLITQLPDTFDVPAQLLLCTVFARFLSRLADDAGIAKHSEVANGFVRVAASTDTSEHWRSEFVTLIDACKVALNRSGSASLSHRLSDDVVVRQVLLMLDADYTKADLSLKDAARVAGRSVWHTSRMLKDRTGLSFTYHLRRRRVVAAQHLLQVSSLSIKEIAVAAGFGDARRLSERFKQLTGETPTAFRRRAHSTFAHAASLTA
jgi:AraC-like DNA-binding protein